MKKELIKSKVKKYKDLLKKDSGELDSDNIDPSDIITLLQFYKTCLHHNGKRIRRKE